MPHHRFKHLKKVKIAIHPRALERITVSRLWRDNPATPSRKIDIGKKMSMAIGMYRISRACVPLIDFLRSQSEPLLVNFCGAT
jgi:hypothetical protein